MELKKEVNTLKEQYKSFQFFLDNLYIKDLNSIIIGDNRDYNKMIKSWINPFKKIKAYYLDYQEMEKENLNFMNYVTI